MTLKSTINKYIKFTKQSSIKLPLISKNCLNVLIFLILLNVIEKIYKKKKSEMTTYVQ